MPGSDRAGRVARVNRFFIAAFTERLAYKAAAVLVALVLWLTLRAENPVDTDIPVRLDLALDSTVALVGQPPPISAYVVGSTRAVNRLLFDPPVIRRTFGPDTPDTVTVELSNDDVMMPPGLSATVRQVQPRRITLRFTTQVSRRVPVVSALRVRAGPDVSLAGAPAFEPDSVLITGTREAVAEIGAVSTVGGELVVRDTSGVTIRLDTGDLPVRVSPSVVRVRIPVITDSAAATRSAFPFLLPIPRRTP